MAREFGILRRHHGLNYYKFPIPLPRRFSNICTLWKNEKFSLIKTFFRQINSLVIYLVNAMLSRNFYQKSVRVNFRNFHTVPHKPNAIFS